MENNFRKAAIERCKRDGAPKCSFRDKSNEKNPMYGKHQSSKAKKSMSESKIGRKWYNNGQEEIFCYSCPENFTLGRLTKELKEKLLLSESIKTLYENKKLFDNSSNYEL